MKVGPADNKLGHGFHSRSTKSFAGVRIKLAPWETLDVPDPIGEEIIRAGGGDFVDFKYMTMDFIYPYQARVMLCL